MQPLLRWAGETADFRFQVKYRSRKSNIDADTLWRVPLDIEGCMKICCEESSSEVVQAAICSAQFQKLREPSIVNSTNKLTHST